MEGLGKMIQSKNSNSNTTNPNPASKPSFNKLSSKTIKPSQQYDLEDSERESLPFNKEKPQKQENKLKPPNEKMFTIPVNAEEDERVQKAKK